MITWPWIFFAALILVANGSENQGTDQCGKESTPPTTTACPCTKLSFLPKTNEKYTEAEWWSNVKNETHSSYNSSFFVDSLGVDIYTQADGCSIGMTCSYFFNFNTTLVKTIYVLVTADNQRHDFPTVGPDDALELSCNHDGQYTHNGVALDMQVGGCLGITQKNFG
ncbi:unnamed protein product [Caenorhabditis nigoni]